MSAETARQHKKLIQNVSHKILRRVEVSKSKSMNELSKWLLSGALYKLFYFHLEVGNREQREQNNQNQLPTPQQQQQY